ncbi:BREX system P-loop protein BrxC [Christiangramia fulva]|uniref:BREX system P-loop protein BrxC n=1 Tax=Christiangramia fulva TaxID=2126553 RepID=A0A2R3Z3E7_9FLAO|nr:BREX system P-loop protein BrxC [Christiangramia fulva]AVR44779.1 BREX system P-loop protein BrxC [Christiangramia fulva]
MTIKEYFLKPVDRPIETVIKADDRDHISTEVAEYVITDEISKKIRELFQAYNNYNGVNGVWISGFFGSGKSHLLKILSYVLENKEVDGYKCGELFAEKIENDEMLKGDVLAATRIPSEAILFNIDQQAQITSKADENAILSVFYKVFFDHLGYYGFQPHVAEFEMWLDKQKKYADFKTKFENLHGQAWEEARIDYFDPMVTDNVAEVLSDIFGKDASKYEDILDEMEDKQKQSIEDFSHRVNEYINTKPSGFKLNFFVDEVGQYISDNTKLMLNLQTIAESLATKTKGRSWILVTSQEDMEKVIGDLTKAQENDFSRIQARFKLKVPLTSANVDEVIEKRLLKKKDNAKEHLIALYKKENAHLETLLSFSEAGVQFKGFKSPEDFANKFPFVPYQFDLFQQCRRALSSHNAFQGKHSSVGERSMLGVFQQVIQQIENGDERTLVSFDKMYSGIKNELRGEMQSSINLAEKNLDNPFAVKVLKALFLVKYFNNFKTTKRNISVLMLDDLDVDLKEHERKIEEALNKLENQSYIQRNGDNYEFLTDDEKDVEQEIKNTDVDEQQVTQLLREILFDEIIRDNRIKYLENKQYYDFTSKIDGITLGREKELEIELITENYPEYSNTTYLQSQTMGSTGMKMVLPPDSNFIKDLKMYLKTDKYVKQNRSTSNRPEVSRILAEKSQLNVRRKSNLKELANKLLSESTVFLNGNKHEMGATSDGKTRVIKAFQDLVKNVYSNLRMLGSTQFSEDTIRSVVRNPQDDLFGTDDSTMSEAENQIFSLINRRKKRSDRTSLSDVKEVFTKKPYGWYPNAIWTVVAKLYRRGKIELKQDSNILEDQDVIDSLINSSYHNNTLLEPQEEIDPKQIRALKDAYRDAFDETCSYNEGKEVAKAFKEKLQGMLAEVSQLQVQENQYPFLASLNAFADHLKRWTKKDYNYFLNELDDFEDQLLDTKEDLLTPIKTFMNSDQKEIYDEIRQLVKGDTSNFLYVEGEELDQLNDLIKNDPKPYQGNSIREGKEVKDHLIKKLKDTFDAEREKASSKIDQLVSDFQSKEEFSQLSEEEKEQVLDPFERAKEEIRKERYISQIRQISHRAENYHFEKQLNEMLELVTEDKPGGGAGEPPARYIKRSNIRVQFDKTELKTEEDVDDYVETLRKCLKEHIKDNKRITL